MMTKQFIYILIHPTQEGYLKIGETKRTPQERAIEITNACKTGLVGKYIVAYEIEVKNSRLIEKIIHKKLDKFRVRGDREFFFFKLKDAIKVIEDVVLNIENQVSIEYEIEDPQLWWNNLVPMWKQILNKSIDRKLIPSEEELLECVDLVIKYCRIHFVRKAICELILDKAYKTKILSWYFKQKNEIQNEINYYNPRVLNIQELAKITNVKKLNCSGNLLIEDLLPIKQMDKIEILNSSNTSIETLEPIKNLSSLKEIAINHTRIKSLKPLQNCKKLKIIKCNQTELSTDEISRFQKKNPKCRIIQNPFE